MRGRPRKLVVLTRMTQWGGQESQGADRSFLKGGGECDASLAAGIRRRDLEEQRVEWQFGRRWCMQVGLTVIQIWILS